MGVQASRDAGAADGPQDHLQEEHLAARAWRTGVPFTLLHDEGFVAEKYQELLAANNSRQSAATTAQHEAQTTVSGLDEAPMDELQHATDVARVKLFARAKREGGGEPSGSRPDSPSSSAAVSATQTSPTGKENPPSALAGMVGNTLSRESPESADSEKLRAQRDELLQVYFEQIAARMNQSQMDAEEETARAKDAEDLGSVMVTGEGEASALQPDGLPMVWEGCKISQDVTPASVLSVGSLRMQLEMLREFRVLSPRLFENGVMVLVQTLLDSPPFALQDVTAGSPEDVLLRDVRKFCRDILRPEQGAQGTSDVQRQVTLLLLLALGVSSGRLSLLLEFVDELLALPRETAASAFRIQGYPFVAWVELFLRRMLSYRIDFALGTFEDSAFLRKFSVKTLPGEVDNSANEDVENGSLGVTDRLSSSSLATDGSFAYRWSLAKGLAKIGTGLNFTIAGRVYAEVQASAYLSILEEKRTVRKLVYGFGEHLRDVSATARDALAQVAPGSFTESVGVTVREIFGTTDDQAVAEMSSKLLVSYCVGNAQDVCVLDDGDIFALPVSSSEHAGDARICRAWYGDFDILSSEAVLKFGKLLEKTADPAVDNDDVGVMFTNELIEQLLTQSGVSPDKITGSKKTMVIFSCGDFVGAQLMGEGDQFVNVERRTQDSYLSSLLYCDDSLYLNVLYPDTDASGCLFHGAIRRCRRLLRISPLDLTLVENLPLEKNASFSGQTSSLGVESTLPVYAYTTEGRLIYEIEVGPRDINVNVVTPKATPEGGKALEVVRTFDLKEKAVQCSKFSVCLAKLRSMMLNNENSEVQWPSFYTNGSSLGALIPDSSARDGVSSKDRIHCVLFDCESGEVKNPHEDGEHTGCAERSLPRASLCFDARNNLLWLYDENKRILRSYQNSGKRIPLDENTIPSDVISKRWPVQPGSGEETSFLESTALSVLSFLYKNAVASDITGREEESNGSMMLIPFAVDVEVDTFKLLLSFTSRYVDVFKSNDASVTQVYILQACLGILNKNLESLLLLSDGRRKQKTIALLIGGLSTPLDKLLEFSSEQDDRKGDEMQFDGALKLDERSRVQVASVALDLYTTSIRIFHSDVGKQFTHVLKYLQLWKQSKTTKMELKILARLLAHLCTRVDVIYQSMMAREDELGYFLKLVEFAVGMQQIQLQQVLIDSGGLSGEPSSAPASQYTTESSFELISLVNAITQASFVGLGYASDTRRRRTFDVAIVVFETIRDACSTICCDLADQVKQQDIQKCWMKVEEVLKSGFVGILAPVVLSSEIMMLRNRKNIEAMLLLNDENTSKTIEHRGGSSIQAVRGKGKGSSESVESCLFEFIRKNSSKLLNLMANLDVLVSMVDPTKREHTVENVSMAVKTETMESSHEYENNIDALTELQVPGATRMVITFDARSRTEVNYDYLTFYKDKSQGEYYGSQFYSGRDSEQNWPGVEDNPPLVIESDHCFVYFHTDGSNTDWGYKFTASAEILERKKSLQQHWIVFLLESVVQLLDESVKLLVDGSSFAPIDEVDIQNERYLQSDLLKSGVSTEESKNAEVLRLLQDFVDPPAASGAERVIQALQVRSGVLRPTLALARSTSFDQITSSAPNQSVNSAVRAVAAAILHHNMWGMDAYAFTQNLRDDISEQLLRGWKNAQKMRDWFHLGDAADAGIHAQMAPNRRRSGRLRRQPSAYKGLSEESLGILCDNVIKRARFLLEITPVSFAYVMGAKRRWGLLAKYGHAIGKQTTSDTQLDKWYNLLDELQAATELRSLFQYRRSSSERLKHGQVKSVTEQVLEFIQSDVDVSEMRKVIEARNRRAASRALGMQIFVQTLKDCSSLRLRGILLESFASTLKSVAIANSPSDLSGPSSTASPNSALDSLPRLHVDTLLSGCDESLRQRIAGAFGDCLALFAKQLASTTDDRIGSGLITGVLRCCAMDYDLEDSYLLQESRVLPQIVRLLSSDSVLTRNAAQSLLGVLLSRFIAGRVESSLEDEDNHHNEQDASDASDVSVFQRQLFSAVGHQLDGIVSSVQTLLDPSHDTGLRTYSPQYLPDNSPGFTAPCLQHNAVSWNHSILLWVYCPSTGPLYALKLGDEVCRGPNWSGSDDRENGETDTGTVISIPTPTKVHVRWNTSGLTSQCEFDPKNGIFEVVLVDEGIGGTIFFKGNKNMVKDTSAAKPWSHFGLFLTDKRMLVYKIACGSDKESVFETDYEMDADKWSHIAIVQDEDILRVYVNGSMVSQHLLESFLVMNANVNPAESAIIESAHPLEDSIDEYCPVHIPGATRIRLTFDPLCDVDSSTGFVRFYKDAKCVEFWGEDKYTGKYSDPERNFPGAQSNRARTLQHAEDSSVDLNVLEIPSDRFLVYFHNEGSSNSWGFRILASPEFAAFENEPTSRVSHLNPYPFYFGVAPGRVLDDPAAKCWIYQPQVLSFPISESDLTTEIQRSFPPSEIVSNCVPAERTLHILGLIRTCAETSFGRSLISTPENLRNIMFLSLDDRLPVEIRVGGVKVLKDLSEMLDADIMDAQFAKALPHEESGFLPFVFKLLGRALNVWRAYDNDERILAAPVDEDEEVGDGLLELRTSAQGEASLVAAYISLLRGTAGHSCWGDQLFNLVIAGLRAARVPNNTFAEELVGQVLASLAILGGSYGGAYIGGRVSCCVNVDGKEMVETGYLVQFRVKSGVQMARVIFDCDQSSTVDVPLTDVAHLDDVEKAELASFLKRMAPFATELKDLYQNVLDLSAGVSPSDDSYQSKLTKKENVEVLESEHPYASGEDVTYSLSFRGANEIVVRFDGMSCTAGPNDYIQFKKKGDKGEKSEKYWGDEKYYGEYFPGVGTTPPLRIPVGSVDVHFYTEGTSSRISEWGFKLTAHAFEEALVYPPEVPPLITTSALCDIRARCIKSLGQLLQSRKCVDIVQNFTTLLPSLTKIANAPCDGRPIQASPKSQIFESKHPYANSVLEYMKVTFSGAATLTISFDPQSRTEQGCDYLCFFKDKSLTDRWGAYQYCGVGTDSNWPGVDDRPPLVISADSFTLLWTTDGSNVDWGWKFNVTAEFLPEFPLDKSLTQLDARSYRLFETLYEKIDRQRIPLKGEFDEFAENGSNSSAKKTNPDPVRQLLSTCSSKLEVSALEWGRSASRKMHQYRVTDEASIKIYQEENRESSVLGELESGAEFIAEAFPNGWLKVASENVSHLSTSTSGWVWQRTGETMHASLCASCANGEDLLTLGVDDLHFENKHSVLEMDESNDEEKSLTSLCSPFAFDEFKGQIDRIQSLAYDSHRAMATKAARDAILTFLTCDPKHVPIQLDAFGGAEEILLLLSHFFVGAASDAAYDNQSSVLLALQKRLKHMVLSGVDDSILSAVLDRCLDVLISGTKLLPKGRGAVRTLESTHPYQDNADQYWDVSIPGATKIKVIFDRRCKSEAGCDWVRIYKSGSNRTETIGPDQIGGRGDSENWPGTGGRPPLYVDDDSFEVYFHSDSSNNDWGFKLYAIGIFTEEEEETPHTEAKGQSNFGTVVKLLSMASWILEALSSIPDTSFQASPAAFKKFYSPETLQTLMLVLDNSPQCIKTCALQIISNMSQSAAFLAIPAVLIEQVRDMLNVKMRAKHQAEERVELKSPYLQTLVQCAIAVDLSIDSHCFDQLGSSGLCEASLSLPYQPVTDGETTFVSSEGVSTSGCYQFRLIFNRLASAVTIGLVDGAPSRAPNFSVRWEENGRCSFGTRSIASNEHILVEIAGYNSKIREGDTVTIQLDTAQQTLVFRKNSAVVALVAGPPGSGALVSWEALQPPLLPESDVRLVVSHSSSENRIEFSSLCCSSVALIPQTVVPSWYSKALDAVSMMLDFRDNVSSTIISRESRHPVPSSSKLSEPVREHVDITGAVALEIRFDKRTKLQKSDVLRFFYGRESGASPENNGEPSFVLSGINGELNEKDTPQLFAGETVKQPKLSLSVGDLVVRSLDWEYSDEDGGAGSLGIVQEITAWGPHNGKGLHVRWQENGFEGLYRYGFSGRYDVQNLENTKYHSAPFVIKGGTFSFEFVQDATEAPAAKLALSSSSDFAGSLELNGMRLELNLVEENECSISKSDFSVECWICISLDMVALMKERNGLGACMEVLRIDGARGRIILLSDQLGRCVVALQAVNEKGELVEHHQCRETAVADNGNTRCLTFGQWIHVALVFSGSKVSVVKNGDVIYSVRCSEHDRLVLGSNATLAFGSSCSHAELPNGDVNARVSCLPLRGHLYDIRLWDVAFRVEQLRSHFRGLDSVDTMPKGSSLPGTPTSASGKPLSPSMRCLASPRSPRSSLRPISVPQHMRRWVTTNLTGKYISTVRLNCSVEVNLLATAAAKSNNTVYFEAHPLTSGKMCIGWIVDGVVTTDRSAMIGEEHGSFGIELGRKLAHFSTLSEDLAPFTRTEPSGCTSPRRSFGGDSFGNDIFSRKGDVIGCAIHLSTGKLTFYVNGEKVAEVLPFSKDVATRSASTDASHLLGNRTDHEFDALIGEIIDVERSAQAGSPSSAAASTSLSERKLYPTASLGPQGAQGVAWNFGQCPFKYEPALESGAVLSLLQASGSEEEDAHFEVCDSDEQHWYRVVYRHKVQEITPRLVGWWKLNEGMGRTVEDASGNNQQGTLVLNNGNGDDEEKSTSTEGLSEDKGSIWWDDTSSPPAAARRRAGDGNVASPFFPFGHGNDAENKSESLWGYKFYVIPHFSIDTVGRRRFQSPSVRFGDSPHNLLPRHDQQMIKYVNKKGQSKDLNVTQLLHGPWSDIAPQENELVRWPALMEIVTSAGDETIQEKAESKSVDSAGAPEPVKSIVDAHGRLSKRFKLLQEFNAALYRILPFISFHAPSVEAFGTSIPHKKFMLSDLVMEHRHRILSAVKRTIWDSALGRTNESEVSFEMTLNRPKAMRFRATGKTDSEGRHTLFSQAFRQLQALDGTHFRREDALYHVTFLGENAQDAGGPYRETFAQYCEELQSTQLPLMLPTPNSQHNVGVGREKWLLSPGAQTATAFQMLEFLGKLMGASIRSKQYLALNLAPLVWKKLAGERLGLDDLAAVDSMLVNSMSKMRTIDRLGVTEEMFEDIVMETFTTLGADNRAIELKPGGAHLPVTFGSRCEYADLVEQARLHESDDQALAILRGLAKVVPAKLLACFSGAELELMVCGSPEVDVDLLEKCTEYSSCSPTDEHIVWFWRALREFSHDERSAFLRFVWGRSRLPASADEFPQRFKLQSFNQQRAGRSVDAYMPVAHTCFFSIEIPAYSSEAVLREKLLYAIYNCQEIDGDGDSVAANQLGWEE